MGFSASPEMRALLQELVNARIDAPEMFARAGELLPPGSDASEEILELLAEGDLQLDLPKDREALAHRVEQYADGVTSYTELDLWFFSLGKTRELGSEAPSRNPEVELLRELIEWGEEWEREAERPGTDRFRACAKILRREKDPGACLRQLEEVLRWPNSTGGNHG